jgi:hypothetical protein
MFRKIFISIVLIFRLFFPVLREVLFGSGSVPGLICRIVALRRRGVLTIIIMCAFVGETFSGLVASEDRIITPTVLFSPV